MFEASLRSSSLEYNVLQSVHFLEQSFRALWLWWLILLILKLAISCVCPETRAGCRSRSTHPLQNLRGNLVRTSFLRKCEGKALGKRSPAQNRAIKKPEDEVALPPPHPLSKISLILWAFLTWLSGARRYILLLAFATACIGKNISLGYWSWERYLIDNTINNCLL